MLAWLRDAATGEERALVLRLYARAAIAAVPAADTDALPAASLSRLAAHGVITRSPHPLPPPSDRDASVLWAPAPIDDPHAAAATATAAAATAAGEGWDGAVSEGAQGPPSSPPAAAVAAAVAAAAVARERSGGEAVEEARRQPWPTPAAAAGWALTTAAVAALDHLACWLFLDDDGVEEDLRDPDRLWPAEAGGALGARRRWAYVCLRHGDLGTRLARAYLPTPPPPPSSQQQPTLWSLPEALAVYVSALRLERRAELLRDGLGRHAGRVPVEGWVAAAAAAEWRTLLATAVARLTALKSAAVSAVDAHDASEGGVLARMVWHGLDLLERAPDAPAPLQAQAQAQARDTLELLLYLPYHRARRGRWWVRLVRLLERWRPAYALERTHQGTIRRAQPWRERMAWLKRFACMNGCSVTRSLGGGGGASSTADAAGGADARASAVDHAAV
jgi:hypothetical protein